MNIVYLENQVEEPVSEKQLNFIRGLMTEKNLYDTLYLDKLAFDTRNRLSKQNASRLIEYLLSGQEFNIYDIK